MIAVDASWKDPLSFAVCCVVGLVRVRLWSGLSRRQGRVGTKGRYVCDCERMERKVSTVGRDVNL